MYQHLSRARRSVIIAMAILPVARSTVSFADIYSATPTTLYTAASGGFTTITVGLNSAGNPTPLVEKSSSTIAGIGFVGGNNRQFYTYTPSTSVATTFYLNDGVHLSNFSTPTLAMISASGTILGTESRTNTSGSTINEGTDVFYVANGAAPTIVPAPSLVLGSGASYFYTDAATGYAVRNMFVSPGLNAPTGNNSNPISAGGLITGQITRYVGSGFNAAPNTGLGTDGYFYDPATGVSTAIGLSGGQYATPSASDPTLFVHSTIVSGLAGKAATGYNTIYDTATAGASAGSDGWIYTPALGTVQIGLVGSTYSYTVSNGSKYEFTQTYRTNALGQIAGRSTTVYTGATPANSPGQAWLYTPSKTPGTATGYGISAAGNYVQLGLFSAPSGSTLGYIGPAVAAVPNFTNSTTTFLANNGHAVGQSNRYDAAGAFEGFAAWYYNGVSNTDISVIDAIHPAVAGGTTASSSTLTALNNTGMAAGFATRFSSTAGGTNLGQDAFIWDSVTATRYFVDPTSAALGATNREFSYVGAISDTGVAVGYYNSYNGTASSATSSTLFDWSAANGLQALLTFNGSGASGSMAAFVSSFTFGPDGTLYGPNTYGTTLNTSIVAYSVTGQPVWGGATSSTWGDASNWSTGTVPNGSLGSSSNAVFAFGPAVTTVDATYTVNQIAFNGTTAHTLNPQSSSVGNLILAGSRAGINVSGYLAQTINVPVVVSADSYLTTTASTTPLLKMGYVSIASGKTLTIQADSNVAAASLNNAASDTGGSLTVNGTFALTIDSAGADRNHRAIATVLTGLSVANYGLFDISNHDLVLKGGAGQTLDSLRQLIQSGAANSTFTGTSGITSSAATVGSGTSTKAIGYLTGGSYLTLNPAGVFDGVTIGAGDLIAKFTYAGDATLDGIINSDDYLQIDSKFLAGGAGATWINGDFNYDGTVNYLDYALIDAAYQVQSGTLADLEISLHASEFGPAYIAALDAALSPTAIPEPASLLLLGAGALLLLNRRNSN